MSERFSVKLRPFSRSTKKKHGEDVDPDKAAEAEMEEARSAYVSGRLRAYREDLAEWISDMLKTNITEDNLLSKIENGVILCQMARMVEQSESDPNRRTRGFASGHQRQANYVPAPLEYNTRPTTRFACRDNIEQFLRWCRGMGVDQTVLFESDSLLERKNEKNVLYCLMELGRVQVAVAPPRLVEIERAMDSGKVLTDEEKHGLEFDIGQVAKKMGLPDMHVQADSGGEFRLGDLGNHKIVKLRGRLMVRRADGWDTLEHVLASETQKQRQPFGRRNSVVMDTVEDHERRLSISQALAGRLSRRGSSQGTDDVPRELQTSGISASDIDFGGMPGTTPKKPGRTNSRRDTAEESSLQDELTKAQNETRFLDARQRELEAELEEMKEELENISLERDMLAQAKKSVEASAQRMADELDQAKRATQENTASEAELQRLREELEQLKIEVAEQHARAEETQRDSQNLSQLLANAQNQLQDKDKALQQAEALIQHRNDQARQSADKELQDAKADYESRLEDLETKLEHERTAKSNAEAALTRAEEEMTMTLQDMERGYDTQLQALEDEVRALKEKELAEQQEAERKQALRVDGWVQAVPVYQDVAAHADFGDSKELENARHEAESLRQQVEELKDEVTAAKEQAHASASESHEALAQHRKEFEEKLEASMADSRRQHEQEAAVMVERKLGDLRRTLEQEHWKQLEEAKREQSKRIRELELELSRAEEARAAAEHELMGKQQRATSSYIEELEESHRQQLSQLREQIQSQRQQAMDREKQLHDEMGTVRAQLAAVRSSTDFSAQDNDELLEKQSELERTKQRLKESLDTQEELQKALGEAKAQLVGGAAKAVRERSEAEAERDKALAAQRAAELRLETEKAHVQELEKQLDDAHGLLSTRNSELSELRAKVDVLEHEAELSQRQRKSAETDLQRQLDQAQRKLDNTIQEHERRLGTMKQELVDAQTRLERERAEGESATSEQLMAATRRVEEIEALAESRRAKAERELTELRESRDQALSDLSDAKQRVDELEHQLEAANRELAALRRQVKDAKDARRRSDATMNSEASEPLFVNMSADQLTEDDIVEICAHDSDARTARMNKMEAALAAANAERRLEAAQRLQASDPSPASEAGLRQAEENRRRAQEKLEEAQRLFDEAVRRALGKLQREEQQQQQQGGSGSRFGRRTSSGSSRRQSSFRDSAARDALREAHAEAQRKIAELERRLNEVDERGGPMVRKELDILRRRNKELSKELERARQRERERELERQTTTASEVDSDEEEYDAAADGQYGAGAVSMLTTIGGELLPVLEQMTEWLNQVLDASYGEETLLDELKDGVGLCKLANVIDNAEEKVRDLERKNRRQDPTICIDASGRNRTNYISQRALVDVDYVSDANEGTPEASSNVDAFIEWARLLGIKKPDVFAPNDLLRDEDPAMVLLGLLDVARHIRGLPVPPIVQEERDRARAFVYETATDDEIDVKVAEVLKHVPMLKSKLQRVSQGRYILGDEKRLLLVRVLRDRAMVRVGGGWEDLQEFLASRAGHHVGRRLVSRVTTEEYRRQLQETIDDVRRTSGPGLTTARATLPTYGRNSEPSVRRQRPTSKRTTTRRRTLQNL